MEGRGKKYFANGNKHDGLWSNDKAHGPGIFFNSSDSSYQEGVWNNGIINPWHYSGKINKKKSY